MEQKAALLALLRGEAPPSGSLGEVHRRARIFRAQAEAVLSERRPLLLLVLPECHSQGEPCCLSCGGPLEQGRWRCAPCALAVRLALERTPWGITAPGPVDATSSLEQNSTGGARVVPSR